MQRISRFIISMLLLLPMFCNAQDTTRYPINAMEGIRIGIDVSKLLLPLIYKGERVGFEATVDMHIKDNFFATVEAGFLNVNLNRKPDYHYRENGLYGKIGADYNLLKFTQKSATRKYGIKYRHNKPYMVSYKSWRLKCWIWCRILSRFPM